MTPPGSGQSPSSSAWILLLPWALLPNNELAIKTEIPTLALLQRQEMGLEVMSREFEVLPKARLEQHYPVSSDSCPWELGVNFRVLVEGDVCYRVCSGCK